METLPNIKDVHPVDAEDDACLSELRGVLKRHGKLGRFGIALLHGHFPVAEDEVLLETCDKESRTLTVRPVRKTTLPMEHAVETSWHLGSGEADLVCIVTCVEIGDDHVNHWQGDTN